MVFGGFTSGYLGANVSILFNLLLFPALAYSILLRTRFSDADLSVFCGVLTLFALYLSCVAILERTQFAPLLIPPDIGDPAVPQHWGRSRGPFIQAEFNGTVMTQLVPVAILLLGLGPRRWRPIALAALPLLCIGVYLTETRAALLALVLIVAAGSLRARPTRRPYVALAAGLGLAVGAVIVAGGVPIPRLGEVAPLADRLTLLSVTAGMITAHPLLGIGFGNFDLVQDAFFLRPQPIGPATAATLREFWAGGTHNTLLTPIAELGVLGGLYLGVVLWGVWMTWRAARVATRTGADGGAAVGALATCASLVGVGFLVNALLVELRFTPTPNLLFWSFVAIAEARALR
jgi:O-antigen ligase